VGRNGKCPGQMASPRRVRLASKKVVLAEILRCSRFPAISGFRVEWDSRKAPGERVLGMWLLIPKTNDSGSDEEPIKREEGGRKYKIVTREYLAQGHDGFEALTRGKWLVDHECGSMFSSIVRKYMLGELILKIEKYLTTNYKFLGARFVEKLLCLGSRRETQNVSKNTQNLIRALEESKLSTATQHWRKAANDVLRTQSEHYREKLQICMTEHMSPVDAFDGQNMRKGLESKTRPSNFWQEDLPVFTPTVDGRLKNVATSL